MKYRIGVDDHDSPIGGCTTHFSTILLHKINDEGIGGVLGLPRLVRLNPNVPWKTRGNAAVSFDLETSLGIDELSEYLWNNSLNYTNHVSRAKEYRRDPGLAVIQFYDLQKNKREIKGFYWRALKDIILLDDRLTRRLESLHIKYLGGRGIIGSVASLGFFPDEEGSSYERILYRETITSGERRRVCEDCIRSFEEKEFPRIFFSYDYKKGKSIATPRGKDPVLLGIRGFSIEPLMKVQDVTEERVEFSQIFLSNQHTGANFKGLPWFRPYSSLEVEIIVKEVDKQGQDVIVEGVNDRGVLIHIVGYRETGVLNKSMRELRKGDRVIFYGALKPSSKLNIILEAEGMEILFLEEEKAYHNPKCRNCGGSTESMGKGKGFRCKRCGQKFSYLTKDESKISRSLSLGIYITERPRHLTLPIWKRGTPLFPLENFQEKLSSSV